MIRVTAGGNDLMSGAYVEMVDEPGSWAAQLVSRYRSRFEAHAPDADGNCPICKVPSDCEDRLSAAERLRAIGEVDSRHVVSETQAPTGPGAS